MTVCMHARRATPVVLAAHVIQPLHAPQCMCHSVLPAYGTTELVVLAGVCVRVCLDCDLLTGMCLNE